MSFNNQNQLFMQDPAAYLLPPIKKDYYDTFYSHLKKISARSVADIGCASGDFFYFMGNEVPIKLGIDISEELINLAKSRVPNAEFLRADIYEYSKHKRKFDAVCMAGTLHTFLEYQCLLTSLISSSLPKMLIIQSPFSTSQYDVRVMHADASDKNHEFQCAYSLFSIEKLILFLEQKGAKVNYSKYNMKETLFPNQSNPMRNYHVNVDGERFLTNGTSIILREFIVVAKF